MDIKIADFAGYCFGVNNAIKLANETLDQNERVYVLGDLTHNHQEMERLEEKGLIKVDSLDGLENEVLLIRAHGAQKEELEQAKAQNLKIVDATCPFVLALHKRIEKYDKEGYQIVIIGDKNHPEVKGAASKAIKKPIILDSISEAKKLKSYDKICIVAQTTFIKEKFDKIVEAIKENSNEVLIFNTICKATSERQEAAAKLAKDVDGMIVIGGYHSSNTRKLKEVCEKYCENTWHIETENELNYKGLYGLESIGITAGASTPDWLIEEVTEGMQSFMFEETVEQDENLNQDLEENQEVEVTTEVESPVSEEDVTVTEEVSPETTVEETVVDPEPSFDDESQKLSDEDFFAAEIDNMKFIRKNNEIEGEVISVSDDEVILNIGQKSDAVIYKRDFTWKRDEELQNLVKEGDKITAIVTELNDGDGRVKLSKIKYDNQQIQGRLKQAFEDKEILYGKVVRVSGKGLMVDVGFTEIFMPASQYHVNFTQNLDSLVGKDVRGVLIDYNAKRRRAILSQKAVLLDEKKQRKEEQLAKKSARFNELAVGDIVKGKIKTITNFGVFVDLNGIDGFIHRSDLTWDRNNEPKNIVEKGNEIEAKIISTNEDDMKIKLSAKELIERPWEKFLKSYAENDIIDVDITNTLKFGAFAKIIPGVEGLIHISEISYDRVESVDSELKPNQTVKVKIIGIDRDRERISLSIKATLPRPERPAAKRNNEENRNRKNRRNRRNNRQNVSYYEESPNFTLGDSFGNLFDDFNFEEFADEYEDFDADDFFDDKYEGPMIEDEELDEVDEIATEAPVDDTVTEEVAVEEPTPEVEESTEEVVTEE